MLKTTQDSKEVQITNILNSSNGIMNLLNANVLTKVYKCRFLCFFYFQTISEQNKIAYFVLP